MRFWWAWWLVGLVTRRKPARLSKPAKKRKVRPVPAYRRADGTDELRRIH